MRADLAIGLHRILLVEPVEPLGPKDRLVRREFVGRLVAGIERLEQRLGLVESLRQRRPGRRKCQEDESGSS